MTLMGPSGCGKTTLLNILRGVVHTTGGDTLVGDQKLAALAERELEKYRLHKVGFVFQFFNLLPTLTVTQNLDEPTGNLDSGNTETITSLFLSLAEEYGKTVIMASHDPKAVEHFKKVYNMHDGNFV